MEIGLIYSRKDPRQAEARDFVRRFCQERGILARIIESEQPVESPTIVINGQALRDRRQQPREESSRMFPALDDIARAIEQHVWAL